MSDLTRRVILYTYTCLSDPSRFIDVGLNYNEGGMNWFTGSNEARGYYLSVQPYEETRGLTIFRGFSGVKQCVRDAKRFSAKALQTLAVEILNDASGEWSNLLQQMLEYTVTKNMIDINDYRLEQRSWIEA